MRMILAAAFAAATAIATPAFAAEPESCATVRFSDVGWTDITATTAATTTVLKALGYDTQMGGNIGIPVLELEPPAI